jgi:hypothetical protein
MSNKYTYPEYTDADVDHMFTYHAGNESQLRRYGEMNAQAKLLGKWLIANTEAGENQAAAMRSLQRLRMDVNLCIALEEEGKPNG